MWLLFGGGSTVHIYTSVMNQSPFFGKTIRRAADSWDYVHTWMACEIILRMLWVWLENNDVSGTQNYIIYTRLLVNVIYLRHPCSCMLGHLGALLDLNSSLTWSYSLWPTRYVLCGLWRYYNTCKLWLWRYCNNNYIGGRGGVGCYGTGV